MNAGPDLSRILVLGTSGSGKSTLARALGRRLGCPVTELDSLFWLPDWETRPLSDFRARVAGVVCGETWIIDGNYSMVRDLSWPRASLVIWLDYTLPRVFLQALCRTLRRVFTRQELFAGNREDFRRAFLSRDSILVWVLKTHARRRRELTRLLTLKDGPPILAFRTPRQTRDWLEGLRPRSASWPTPCEMEHTR